MSFEEFSLTGQWTILFIFFGLFFISGLFNKPKMKQFEYYHFYLVGALVIIGNLVMLSATSTNPGNYQELLSVLSLQKNSLESSFVVFGYLLICRGFGQFIRGMFGYNRYSKQIKL
jgi:hypothetical protein